MKQTTLLSLHKWTGIVVGIQFLIWSVTGLYFSLTGHLVLSSQQHQTGVHSAPPRPIDVAEWHPQFENMTSATVRNIADLNQWVVTLADGQTQWFQSQTGRLWQTDPETAKTVASASYAGPGKLTGISYFEDGFPALISEEVTPESTAVYEVAFDDNLSTRVYVSEQSGQVVAHRNKWSTLHDWAFRLHFMDYNGGKNFNNPLTWIFAAGMLWFIFTGLWLLKRIYFRR